MSEVEHMFQGFLLWLNLYLCIISC